MPTSDYTIECLDVQVEYEFHEWVEPKPYADVVGEDAWIDIIGPEWLFALPDSVLDDIREHFLAAELAGPDPDRKHDEGNGKTREHIYPEHVLRDVEARPVRSLDGSTIKEPDRRRDEGG